MKTIIKSKKFDEMDLPETIYKYRTWTDPFHKRVITNREVFLAKPTSFEDPFDCKNSIRYDLMSEEERIAWMAYKLGFEVPDMPANFYLSKAREMYPNSLLSDNKSILEFQEEEFKKYDVRMGVLSLTANPMNQEMWQKYSEDFKGLCIGFDPRIMFKYLGGGSIVEYVPELPMIYPEPKHDFLYQTHLQVCYKLEKWKFEEEYRTHKFRNYPLSNEERTVTLPPEAYREILIGPEMPDHHKAEIRAAIPVELAHVKIIELHAESFNT